MPALFRSGWAPCLFAVLVWGATFATTKRLLEALPPTEILLARFVVGYLALWALAPRRLPWQGWRTEARMALAGVLGIALYFHFENQALVHARAGMVAVVVCVSPLLTALLARLLGRVRRLGRGYWLGFALAVAALAAQALLWCGVGTLVSLFFRSSASTFLISLLTCLLAPPALCMTLSMTFGRPITQWPLFPLQMAVLDCAGGLVDVRALAGCLMGAAVVTYAAGMAFDALRLCATER